MKAAAKTLKFPICSQSNKGLKCAVSPLPNKSPKRIIPKREPSFKVVKKFCVVVTNRTPNQCRPESHSTTIIENSVPTVTCLIKPGTDSETCYSFDPRTG